MKASRCAVFINFLAEDLTRIEKVVDDATRKHSQRI